MREKISQGVHLEKEAFYIPYSEARKELENRSQLRKKVEQWWNKLNWQIPRLFQSDKPIAGFGRAIGTYRYEDALFEEYSKASGLTPYWLEYTASKFSTESALKKTFLQPQFLAHRGVRKQGAQMHPVHLAPFQHWRGRPLNQIRQIHTNELLVHFHHRLHDERIAHSRLDLSEFYGQFGDAHEYYEPYLSLFLAHGVLFEDYHSGESGEALAALTHLTFIPAFRRLEQRFGVGPMIVCMPWHANLRFYPRPDTDWREDGMIPENLLPRMQVTESELLLSSV